MNAHLGAKLSCKNDSNDMRIVLVDQPAARQVSQLDVVAREVVHLRPAPGESDCRCRAAQVGEAAEIHGNIDDSQQKQRLNDDRAESTLSQSVVLVGSAHRPKLRSEPHRRAQRSASPRGDKESLSDVNLRVNLVKSEFATDGCESRVAGLRATSACAALNRGARGRGAGEGRYRRRGRSERSRVVRAGPAGG